MVQVDRTEILSRKEGGIYEQYNHNKNIATTATYATLLDIDCRAINESVFIIHNVTGGDLDYQILATAEDIRSVVDPDGTNDDDKGWVNLKTNSIATGTAPVIETLGNPYTRIVLQIKHTTLTTDVSAWHRGER